MAAPRVNVARTREVDLYDPVAVVCDRERLVRRDECLACSNAVTEGDLSGYQQLTNETASGEARAQAERSNQDIKYAQELQPHMVCFESANVPATPCGLSTLASIDAIASGEATTYAQSLMNDGRNT
jgi:hypothetical protein